MSEILVFRIPAAVLAVLLSTSLLFAQTPRFALTTDEVSHVYACESRNPKTYVVPIGNQTLREELEFAVGHNIIVEPSATAVDLGNPLTSRFNYRIIREPSGESYQLMSLGTNTEEALELAYRRLESVGISCFSRGDALVYLSFAVNGSVRDFFYVAIHTGKGGQPIVLGRSRYGVLAINPAHLLEFSIWDSSRATLGNGMGAKHNYLISNYHWLGDERSFELITKYESPPVYPGQVLGKSEVGIRVGNPVVK